MVRRQIGRGEGGGVPHVLLAPVAVAYDRIGIGPRRSLHGAARGLYRALEHAALAEHRAARLGLPLRLLHGEHALDVAGTVLQGGHADDIALMGTEDVVGLLRRHLLCRRRHDMVLSTGDGVELGHVHRLWEGERRRRIDGIMAARHGRVGLHIVLRLFGGLVRRSLSGGTGGSAQGLPLLPGLLRLASELASGWPFPVLALHLDGRILLTHGILLRHVSPVQSVERRVYDGKDDGHQDLEDGQDDHQGHPGARNAAHKEGRFRIAQGKMHDAQHGVVEYHRHRQEDVVERTSSARGEHHKREYGRENGGRNRLPRDCRILHDEGLHRFELRVCGEMHRSERNGSQHEDDAQQERQYASLSGLLHLLLRFLLQILSPSRHRTSMARSSPRKGIESGTRSVDQPSMPSISFSTYDFWAL